MIGFLAPVSADPEVRGLYRSYQCGLCHCLGAEYGLAFRMLAGPDLVLYNAWLDAVAGQLPALGHRACVAAPVLSRLPVRARTEHTRLAAAFGVWMMVEKLRDNWQDEGGLHRWLAWKALSRGAARARARLLEQGFPVAEIGAWMKAQATLEERPQASLEEAMAPTRRIAALAYGFAGRARPGDAATTQALGDAIGAWLFWLDGLLDWQADRAAGAYNPLARSLEAPAPARLPAELPAELPAALRARALAGADGAADAMAAALAGLGPVPALPLLRAALVQGPAARLGRLRALPPEQATSLAALQPRRPLRRHGQEVLGHAWRFGLQQLSHSTLRVRLLAVASVMWLFPALARAQEWWPQDAASLGLDTGTAADTGVQLATAAHATGASSSGGLDLCAGNCGVCDINSCCDSVCSPVCNDSCGNACDGASCGGQ